MRDGWKTPSTPLEEESSNSFLTSLSWGPGTPPRGEGVHSFYSLESSEEVSEPPKKFKTYEQVRRETEAALHNRLAELQLELEGINPYDPREYAGARVILDLMEEISWRLQDF